MIQSNVESLVSIEYGVEPDLELQVDALPKGATSARTRFHEILTHREFGDPDEEIVGFAEEEYRR